MEESHKKKIMNKWTAKKNRQMKINGEKKKIENVKRKQTFRQGRTKRDKQKSEFVKIDRVLKASAD